MFIVHHRKYFYALSLVLVVASIVALALWGLKPGIDFKGGSIVEVVYTPEAPSSEVVTQTMMDLGFEGFSLRVTEKTGYIIRTVELSPEKHNELVSALSNLSEGMVEKRFDSVGPILGREALEKSWVSIALVLIAIVLFVTFAFRRVSRPVKSWKYGLIAILALAHDVIIPTGMFAVLGYFVGIEVDTLFVTALLVILGFSVHDTIVVFDRVRENLKHNVEGKEKKSFERIIGESINQTFVRSVTTSLTTIIAILALYVFGAEATKNFSLALLIGITAGTYSSIFLASPLLVTVYKWQEKNS